MSCSEQSNMVIVHVNAATVAHNIGYSLPHRAALILSYFKRYAQVPPSPNDSGMHWHAHIGHGPQCVGRLGRARSRGCRGGEAGQMGRAAAVRPSA